ncbi:MAG: hypothetical protein KBE91_04425 [Bacteroidia bacterium]|nr:hypothetical protein [Bacteroidia bacterium]
MMVFNDKIYLAAFVICLALSLLNADEIVRQFWSAMAVIVGAIAHYKLVNFKNLNNEKQ